MGMADTDGPRGRTTGQLPFGDGRFWLDLRVRRVGNFLGAQSTGSDASHSRPSPSRDHLVVERLALLAPEHPSETVRCLALMVDGAEEDWHIHHWATDVETILKAALQSADEEASQSARAIIHRLGSRGFLQFAVLLENE